MDKTWQMNQQVIELWKLCVKPDNRELMPFFYPRLSETVDFLFIGLNPSFGTKFLAPPHVDREIFDPKHPEKFFLWRNFLARNNATFDIEIAQKIDEHAKHNYQYFKRFTKIADRLNAKWEHVDLFLFRQTDQSQFKRKICCNNNFKNLREFGTRQLELSKQVISELRPKLIVVVNALAADIFKRKFEVAFDEKLHCYTTQLREKTVRAFFTPLASPYIRRDIRRNVKRQIEKAFLSDSLQEIQQ